MGLVTPASVEFRAADLLRLAITDGHMGTSSKYRGDWYTVSTSLYKNLARVPNIFDIQHQPFIQQSSCTGH
jgi:hypothetical protein